MNRSVLPGLLFIFFIGMMARGNSQSISYAGGTYSQSFDGLPLAGSFTGAGKGPFFLSSAPFNAAALTGWQLWMQGGSGANALFAAGTGSSTGNAVYSLGSSASSDRALGSLSSGSGIYSFGCVLTNNSGSTLNSFTLSFTAEQWRKGGSGNTNTWTFHYKTGSFNSIDQTGTNAAPLLNMVSVLTTTGALTMNGNLPENRRQISVTIQNLIWKNGEQLLLRWDDADETGNDDACGIDDLNFVASQNSAAEDTVAVITSPSPPADITAPFITNVDIPASRVYKAGDTMLFGFHFSEPVVLTNTVVSASFSLTVGTKTKTAAYASGNNSSTIWFQYIIPSGESDKDGIRINSPLVFHDTDISDTAGNKAILSYTFPDMQGILVDGVIPVISSIATPAAGVYRTGNLLDFIVSFSKKIWTQPDTASWALGILIGEKTKTATCIGGSGSNALLFRYAVDADDMDKDGIKLISPLKPEGGRLLDDAGNIADLTLNNIGALSGIVINPPVIAVQSVLSPSPGIYKKDDPLLFTVKCNETVWVNTTGGIPSLKFTMGSTQRQALYTEGSGTTQLLFLYKIQSGDLDTNGISLNANMSLNNAAITDSRGNNLPLALNNPGETDAILIDAVAPVVKSVTTPVKNIYHEKDTLDFIINFSEKVWIDSTAPLPFLKLTIGNEERRAVCTGGNGTSSLLFRYAIPVDDLDKNGIRLDTLINNPNTLRDVAFNTPSPVLKNIGALSGVKIDGVAPIFESENNTISLCANGSIDIGSLLRIKDRETGEALICECHTQSLKGTVSKTTVTLNSNGTSVQPEKIIFTAAPEYTGTDSMTVTVTDGIHLSEKLIRITVLPGIGNNIITTSQMICQNSNPRQISGSVPTGGDGNYLYSWQLSSADDSTGYKSVIPDNMLKDLSPPKISIDSWIRRKVESAGCIQYSNSIKITVLKKGLWLGEYDTIWNNPNNWCANTIPDTTTDVYVLTDATYQPFIHDNGNCRNITVAETARLAVSGVLQITGKIYGEKNIQAENATMMLAGHSPQIIPSNALRGHAIKSLIINNPTGVSVDGSLDLSGNLIINAGILNTNDQLVLHHNAMVGACSDGAAIAGAVQMERFIRCRQNSFQVLGNPFAFDLSVDSIAVFGKTNEKRVLNDLFTLSTFGSLSENDSLTAGAGWNLLHDQNVLPAIKEHSVIGLHTKSADSLTVANTTDDPETWKLHAAGLVHTGQQQITVGDTSFSYRFISNPYPAPVDLSRVSFGKGIFGHYWIWHPEQGVNGGYTANTFSNPYVIPPFGALLIKTKADGDKALVFAENAKSADTTSTLPFFSTDDEFMELRLENDSAFFDRIVILGADTAWYGLDEQDAEKFWNPSTNFYTLSREMKALSIDARPLNDKTMIPVGIRTNLKGNFTIRASGIRTQAANALQLHDRYLHRWMKLEKDSVYRFEVTNDTLSQGDHRFEIAAWQPEPDTATTFRFVAAASPVPARDHLMVTFHALQKGNTVIRLLSVQGTPLTQWNFGLQKDFAATLTVANIPPGLYLLEIRCGEQLSVKKIAKAY